MESQIGTDNPGTSTINREIKTFGNLCFFTKAMALQVVTPTKVPPSMSRGPNPPIKALLIRLAIPNGILKKGKIALKPYIAVAMRI